MNGIPPKKKKNTEAYKIPTAQSMKGYKPIVGKQQVQDIFPISIEPNQLTPQLKQYIFDMEKQYLELQATLMNNRAKYQQMFSGLAALLDERGVSSEEMAKFFEKAVYYPPDTN